MIFFTVLVFTCLVSAFISCALGFFVLGKNSSSEVNRLFFAMMLGATYWALGEYLLWTAGGADGLHFWLKVSAFWPVVIAICIHFILTFTGHPFSKAKYPPLMRALLYIPALIISLVGIFTDEIFTVVYQPDVGWEYMQVDQSPVNLAVGIYILAVLLWAMYVTVTTWQHAKDEKIRHQIRLVGIGLAILIVFGYLSWEGIPHSGIHIPNEIFIGNVFFSLIIVYAIQRYGLFTLSPETAVPDILRTMPDGVVIADPEGKIIVANAAAAKILKMSEQDLHGCLMQDLFPVQVCTAIRSALLSTGTVSDLEAVLTRGEYCVAGIAGTLVRDPSGKTAGFVLILRDITDRKSGETALRVANEKISLLSQMTRHDISNLVTALSGYLDLLKEKNDTPENSAYLATCTGIVEKISRHLQFSREYQEIGSHQPAWQLLDWLIARGITAFPHEGITITTHVAPVEIYTDPLAFKVMYNLFENAVRHGGHIRRFEVSTQEQPDGTLLVIFADDGVGVRNEDKPRIFDYGYGSHTGIGLSLSRDILLMTGIRIAETGTAGKGARFEISVPPGAWRAARLRTW
ncbi:MAG: histidine kinase N-terminal 7TM domain-containing protein [Methanoregula sp.]